MRPADKAAGAGGGGPEKDRGSRASKCPLCGKPTAERFRPFCSRRCADVDLGRWLGGHYAISGPAAPGQDVDSSGN